MFHLIPYLLKLKKNAREGTLTETSFKAIRKFMGSLLFMATTVAFLKAALCLGHKIPPYNYDGIYYYYLGYLFIKAAIPSAFGIFF
jgi:hypothetical protein